MVDIGIEDSRMKYYAMIDGERRGPYELDRLADAVFKFSQDCYMKAIRAVDKNS